MEGLFLGRYECAVAADGTVRLPSPWAKALRPSTWVGIGLHPTDGCLVVGTDEQERLLTRAEVDDRGRMLLPPDMRQQVQIRDRAVLIGAVRSIRICPPEKDAFSS